MDAYYQNLFDLVAGLQISSQIYFHMTAQTFCFSLAQKCLGLSHSVKEFLLPNPVKSTSDCIKKEGIDYLLSKKTIFPNIEAEKPVSLINLCLELV